MSAYALYDESAGAYPGVIWEGAQASKGTVITTFAFCSEFPGTSFIWDFYKTTANLPYGDGQAFHEFLKIGPKGQWCYMQGVAAVVADSRSVFNAGLGIDQNPPPPWDDLLRRHRQWWQCWFVLELHADQTEGILVERIAGGCRIGSLPSPSLGRVFPFYRLRVILHGWARPWK